MASSLSFNLGLRDLIPGEVLTRLRIIPLELRNRKLSLIARRPLTDDALVELKALTGIEDYELQLVGDDVLNAYIDRFVAGSLNNL
jgi:hypothetical protein